MERWRPREVKRATCARAYLAATQNKPSPVLIRRTYDSHDTQLPCKDPPTLSCGCGLWALKERDTFVNGHNSFLFTGASALFGVVDISGKIIEGKLGYRAALAKIVALVYDDTVFDTQEDRLRVLHWADKASRVYDVPLLMRWPNLDEFPSETVVY